jgi:hypothetical protein
MSKLVKQMQRKLIKLVPPQRRLRLTHTVAKFIPAPKTPVGTPAMLPYRHKELALAAVRSALEASGVEYFRVPARRPFATQIGVTDAAGAAQLIQRIKAEGLAIERRGGGAWNVWSGSPEFGCTVTVWRPSGDELVTDLPNAMTQRVRADRPLTDRPEPTFGPFADFDDASVWPTRPEFTETPAQRVDFPIDVVYTWVDGADPAWRARRDAALAKRDGEHHALASNESRYTDHGELRYSMRSLWSYAPWFRRVYLVTDDQVPDWLNTDHPRLRVVSHKELFGDRGVLPTFNSHAIESQLHRLPGLSNRFLYINDDVMFARPLGPETFFDPVGHSHFFRSPATVDTAGPGAGDTPVEHAARNNRRLLQERFGRINVNKMKHAAHALQREVLAEIAEASPESVEATASHQFRHPDDLSMTSSLHHYWAYLSGRAAPWPLALFYADLTMPSTPIRLRELLRSRDRDMLCLNDTDGTEAERHLRDQVCRQFFEAYFPVPSPFELPEAGR